MVQFKQTEISYLHSFPPVDMVDWLTDCALLLRSLFSSAVDLIYM